MIPLPEDAEVVELQQIRDQMGDEMDRIVLDWHTKLQEVENAQAPPKCSGCGYDCGVMWVCEGFDDPECGGHQP